jgi:hypothetical protein
VVAEQRIVALGRLGGLQAQAIGETCWLMAVQKMVLSEWYCYKWAIESFSVIYPRSVGQKSRPTLSVWTHKNQVYGFFSSMLYNPMNSKRRREILTPT